MHTYSVSDFKPPSSEEKAAASEQLAPLRRLTSPGAELSYMHIAILYV